MRAMLAAVLVCCALSGLQAAELQNIQNARPLNVDLTSQSDTALANSAGAEIDEHKLGGYRPLYPPYFLREPTTQQPTGVQPKSVYYDQEYYTRGAHPGITDDRLDRQLKLAAGNPFLSGLTFPVTQPAVIPSVRSVIPETGPVVQPPTLTSFLPALTDDRNNRQIKITRSHFAHSASSSFSSSYEFRNVRFPSS